ncbi:MAG: thiamine pyrophosphate-binding protein, partial [Ruminococcus sp.]|nr:thiamine pyrophosphate-binding protein [Ruminococcus sp.]
FIVKDIRELADTLRTAFKIAKSGRPGPVLVDIPKDIQTAVWDFEPKQEPIRPYPLNFASDSKLRRAAEMIKNSERPYIYFGGGIISGKASDELLKLADKIDSPIGCSLMGLSAVPTDHPRFLGMNGMHGHYASSIAQDEADLVICLGARFSDRATGDKKRFNKNFQIIHIDIDSAELDKNITSDLTIQGDIKDALFRLVPMISEIRHPEWSRRIEELRQEENKRLEQASASAFAKHCENCTHPCDKSELAKENYLTPYQIIDIISKTASENDIIVTDVGQHQMWTAQRYPFKRPRTFLTSGGLGTMGYGMGAAIGAVAASRNRSVLFTGDGSFGMNLNELTTAVSNNMPLVIVIMNNGVLGMVRQWQTLFFDKHYSNTTLNRQTDFVKLAEAFGAKGTRVFTTEELEKTAKEAFSYNGVYLIDCAVDCDEFVLPMLPPGGSIEDIITEIK